MKNATNIENTIIVMFLILEHNIKVDEIKRMWSKEYDFVRIVSVIWINNKKNIDKMAKFV